MPSYESGDIFLGPHSSPNEPPTYTGLYMVACISESGNYALDVGQAENIKERIKTHGRKECWNKKRIGSIYYYVTDVQSDLFKGMLESSLRQKYNPPREEI